MVARVFLKRLSIKGFKSFADAATLELEPGVTVVVGPNGSGKSNVVDAVAWVLGAQAPSAVRSQRMDDVIFAGTADRTALGRAEVSLTIDNSDKSLSLDFSEITITRTLFRSGESEYSLNKAPCRLLDIQELLSDVGVGRQQHVIISQGQIDAVLNAREEDRRSIIEDAAGILKYRKRKEKAERRLDSTGANLDRLGDMQREVKRQLRPLERQAEAARRHGNLLEELSALRLFRNVQELNELRNQAIKESEQRSDLSKQEALSNTELKKFDAEILSLENELANNGGDDLGDQLVRYEALRERGRGLKAVLAERLKGIERERELLVSTEVIAGLEAELIRVGNEEKSLREENDGFAPISEILSEEENKLKTDWAAFKENWSDGVPLTGGQASKTRGELGVLRASAEQKIVEKRRLEKRLNDAQEFGSSLEEKTTKRRSDELAVKSKVDSVSSLLNDCEKKSFEVNEELDQAREKLSVARIDFHGTSTEVDTLSHAINDLNKIEISKHLIDTEGVLGALSSLIEIEAGYEKAFEGAVGEVLETIVVETPDKALNIFDEIDEQTIPISILALGLQSSSQKKPSLGKSLRPHIVAKKESVCLLLDRLLLNVVLVETDLRNMVDLAVKNPEIIFVNQSGDRFAPNGWKIGTTRITATQALLLEAKERLILSEETEKMAQSVFLNIKNRSEQFKKGCFKRLS